MKDLIKNRFGISLSMFLFMLLVAFVAIGNGMSDSIYGNYFKDAYEVTTTQRAFIEFPRELPGMLCGIIITSLGFLGDLRISLLAQFFAILGITVLGVTTPSFNVMLIFLFINSLGMHIFMPLQDSICMNLAEKDKIGKRMGEIGSIKTTMGFLTGIIVFLGFRFDIFSFKTDIKWVFLLAAIAFSMALVICVFLIKEVNRDTSISFKTKEKAKLVLKPEYKYYYTLTVLHGVQKQIAYVFGSWVVIDLLLKGADIMSLLTISASFIGIFFMKRIGLWMDKLGIKFMMYVDALSFIVIYVLYGFVVWGISESVIPSSGWPVFVVYFLFVCDRLSMQTGMVKSVYLKSIALEGDDVTSILSTGISLDHLVAIVVAQISGVIWSTFGPQWVFFMAAFFSLGNLFVAYKIELPMKK